MYGVVSLWKIIANSVIPGRSKVGLFFLLFSFLSSSTFWGVSENQEKTNLFYMCF